MFLEPTLPANQSDDVFPNAKANLTSEAWSPTKESCTLRMQSAAGATIGGFGSVTNLFL